MSRLMLITLMLCVFPAYLTQITINSFNASPTSVRGPNDSDSNSWSAPYDRGEWDEFNKLMSLIDKKLPQMKGAKVLAMGLELIGPAYTVILQKGSQSYTVVMSEGRQPKVKLSEGSNSPLAALQKSSSKAALERVDEDFMQNPIQREVNQIYAPILTGANYDGNYLWSAAASLAWNALIDDSFGNPVVLSITSAPGRKQVDNFNQRPFTADDARSQLYIAKNGQGLQTVNYVDQEINRRNFSGSATKNLGPSDSDFVAYSYLYKTVQPVSFLTLQRKLNFTPLGESTPVSVLGLRADTPEQRRNIEVLSYRSDNEFVLRLRVNSPKDFVYLVKSTPKRTPQQIGTTADNTKLGTPLSPSDSFSMPIFDIYTERSYDELSNSTINSKGKWQSFRLAAMLERIKFHIDEMKPGQITWSRVPPAVNGIVGEETAMAKGNLRGRNIFTANNKPAVGGRKTANTRRNFNLDSPFWVVVKQDGAKNPYLIAHLKNAEFMLKV